MLDGATIPGAEQLPDDLQRLMRRNAEFIDHRTVDTDVERLIRKLRLTDRPAQTDQPVQTAPASPVVAPSGFATVEDQMRAKGRIKVDAKFIQGAPSGWFKPGAGKTEWFQDHEAGPEMVVVPAGSFIMGSPEQEWGRGEGETQVPVTIARPFAVGKFAVTFDQWDACVADGGCNGYRPADQGWGRGNRPVIGVNWDDAKAYAAWLSRKTGKTYRLLSEAEREYVTRAGTKTPFWWGSSISPKQANYDGDYAYAGGAKGEFRQQTMPADSFEANPWQAPCGTRAIAPLRHRPTRCIRTRSPASPAAALAPPMATRPRFRALR
jgi:formylglycine-generating enzyme required for sulfatase activity